MRRRSAIALMALCLETGHASAHRIDEFLQATMLSVGTTRIDASMRLVPGARVAAATVADIDRDGDGVFSNEEQAAYARRVVDDQEVIVDGRSVRPAVRQWTFPSPGQLRAGLGEIRVDYAIDLSQHDGLRTVVVTNRHAPGPSVYLANVLAPRDPAIRVLAQRRDRTQSVYAVDYARGDIAARSASNVDHRWWNGLQLRSLFVLGAQHIAGGTDHLLFLLVLLLSAPLAPAGGRWGAPVGVRRGLSTIARVVTAFTIGHSVSLLIVAIGGYATPGRTIEVLVALSILVSAVHACRPHFAGREPLVAAAFGLVHGMAFAGTLERLGTDRWSRVAGTLAFNLGIEAMQLLMVIAVLPSLLVLSQNKGYTIVRIAGALFAGTAAMGWIVERLLDVRTPVDAVVDRIAGCAPWLAAILAASAMLITIDRRLRHGGERRRAGLAAS